MPRTVVPSPALPNEVAWQLTWLNSGSFPIPPHSPVFGFFWLPISRQTFHIHGTSPSSMALCFPFALVLDFSVYINFPTPFFPSSPFFSVFQYCVRFVTLPSPLGQFVRFSPRFPLNRFRFSLSFPPCNLCRTVVLSSVSYFLFLLQCARPSLAPPFFSLNVLYRPPVMVRLTFQVQVIFETIPSDAKLTFAFPI